jgi:hypothetical protein
MDSLAASLRISPDLSQLWLGCKLVGRQQLQPRVIATE